MRYTSTIARHVRPILLSLLPCLLLLLAALPPATVVHAAEGAVDPTFMLSAFDADASTVYAMVVQPDGKILIGGEFTSINGETRHRIARLNTDGTLDLTFAATSVDDGVIYALALQPDGKILIGGKFSRVNGTPHDSLVRLNADGTLDPTFHAVEFSGFYLWQIVSIALQPDGKILIGGEFTRVNGERRSNLARLNIDGSLDLSFTPLPNDPGITSAMARKLVVQPDGKVLAGGWFTSINGGSDRIELLRFNADGSLDATFPVINRTEGGHVNSMALQPDGKILIVGVFSSIGGVRRLGIARLHPDGSLDHSFVPPYPLAGSEDLALQADGKVLLGTGALTRLNPDGTLDATFAAADVGNGKIRSIKLQPDGKVMIAGRFATVGGVNRSGAARILNTFSPRLALNPQVTTIDQTQTFELALQFDLSSMPADRVVAHLRFDPTALEVIDALGNPAPAITPNPEVADAVTENRVDPVTGEIVFSLSTPTSAQLSGYGTLASIRFRPKALTHSTLVQFARNDTQQSDLLRGETPLQATLEHAAVRIVEHRLFLPTTLR
ncbi:MAG TPA: hypothetical protein VFZ66_00710 [Herpetosiphonaceae bacterium]